MNYSIIIIPLLFSLTSCTKYEYNKTYKSTNNEYSLTLFIEKEYKPYVSLSSESSYRKAYVILKDKKDNTITEPDFLDSCTFLLTDLSIEWELENERVYFTKFSYIDIKEQSIFCLEP